MASLQIQNFMNIKQTEIVRPVANFSPSLWGDLFASFSFDTQLSEIYAGEIEELKEKVRNMIVTKEDNLEKKLSLIDTVERLGLSYHFEKEIEDELRLIFNQQKQEEDNHDLFTISLRFRLLRQHGFHASSCKFKKFTECNGKFKKILISDVKGLLSLYEASYVRYHGERILEEALSFASEHLSSRDLWSDNDRTQKRVEHVLEQSHQRGVRRIEARHFISSYQEEPDRDEDLARFAKLDYNQLQMLHRRELNQLTRWWKGMDLVTKLRYPRDRLVECYFFALGAYVEPQYSQARVMLGKIIAMISIVDDTFDSYGTVEELQIFTSVIERWDVNEMNKLPDYMKIVFQALVDVYNDYEKELTLQGRSFAVAYAKDAMIEIVKNYNIEAKWFIEGYIPSFDDYLRNGYVTSTYQLLAVTSLIGMTSASEKAFEWLMAKPRIQVANMAICRIIDDTATYETEKSRGQVGTGIQCYMQQYAVSEEEAIVAFHVLAEDAWKDINEEYSREDAVPKEILKRIVNFARLIDVTYKNDLDGYTDPEKVLKPHIVGLLLEHFNL